MRDMIRMVVVLTVLSALSGGLLAAVRDVTKAPIENNELTLVKGPALLALLSDTSNDPVADRFKLTVDGNSRTFFVGAHDGTPDTVAFEVFGNGYGDRVGVMVAVDTADDRYLGIGVTTHKETPGLGANAKDDPSFAAQFAGLPVGEPLKTNKDGGSINAISGATITSRAVCAAAAEAGRLYRETKPQLLENMQTFKK